jgi:penicillin-binding protein 1A
MYLREHLKKLLVKLAKEDKQYQKPDGSPYDIYRDGLHIYTTIDSRVQAHAEKAAWDHLKKHQEKLFKVWKDWDKDDTEISARSKNPWTYKLYKNTAGEMELRRKSLLKHVWNSDRYQRVRSKYMPTVVAEKLRDVDVDRLLQIVDYNKKPRKEKKKTIDGRALFNKWKETGYIKDEQADHYAAILSSPKIEAIIKEQKAIMKHMKTPTEMTIFAYNKKASRDTTLSPYDSIKYHRMHLQTGSIAVDPRTGAVKSWVGGINHEFFQFDHVNKDLFARQVGSTIKPFLYGLAVQFKGYSPCQKVWDQPTTISKGEGQFGLVSDWTPNNVGGFSGDEITLTEALNRSLNSVSAYLMKDLKGTKPFVNFLADIGIDTTNGRVPNQPSICLGTPNLSPFEMAGGYTIFANEGIYTEPMFIDRIEDKNGNVIYSAGAGQSTERVLTEQDAYVMNEMLQRIQRGRLRGVKSKYGGKTGTTNSYADGWFMGITPDLVVGTWVGCDDRYIRFKSIGNGQGARMARPIFQNLLLNLESDSTLVRDRVYSSKSKFPVPQTLKREMNCIKFTELANKSKGSSDATSSDIYNDDY